MARIKKNIIMKLTLLSGLIIFCVRSLFWQNEATLVKSQKAKGDKTVRTEHWSKRTWPELKKFLISLNTNSVLLALTDGGYEDMTMNFYLSSLKPLNINNYVLLTMDQNHHKKLQDQGLNVFYAEDKRNLTVACNYASKECIKKFKFRLEVVLYLVENQFSVLLSDTDLVFFQNPLNYSEQALHNTTETCLSIIEDVTGAVCGGFIFFKSSKKSETILTSAIKRMNKDPTLNDQHALIAEFGKKQNKPALKFYPEKLYMRGELFWGNYYSKSFKHEFTTEYMSCYNNCHVIHNNYIVSLEAKRYRMRENMFWVYDSEVGYYSCQDRLYLTFDNPAEFNSEEVALRMEWTALQGALMLSEFLNRTLILPAFRCHHEGATHNCSLLHRLRISKFERSFPNYREHVFLNNPLVPKAVKQSQSPVYCFSSQFQIKLKNGPPCQVNVTVGDHKFVHRNEIKTLFENSTYKVLRFSWLYDLNGLFDDSNLDIAFEQRLKSGFEKCQYMQFDKKLKS